MRNRLNWLRTIVNPLSYLVILKFQRVSQKIGNTGSRDRSFIL